MRVATSRVETIGAALESVLRYDVLGPGGSTYVLQWKFRQGQNGDEDEYNDFDPFGIASSSKHILREFVFQLAAVEEVADDGHGDVDGGLAAMSARTFAFQADDADHEGKSVPQSTSVLWWVSHISVDVGKDTVAFPKSCLERSASIHLALVGDCFYP